MTAPNDDAPVLELRDIVKSFPGVRALDGVGFACRPGEVHALVGENGAGKSTLIKILSGAYQADAGTIRLGGETVRFRHPVESLRARISVIYQELSLLPDRTVAENVFLGREPARRGVLDRRRMNAETGEVLEMVGAGGRIRPDSLVGDLELAARQMVEIAKAVSLDARVIVMDEPTAALNGRECELLFALVDTLRAQGRAVIYITHRMREVARLADRVTVLKDGAVAAAWDRAPEADEMIRAMVGRDIGDFYPPPATADERGEVILSVRGGGNDRLDGIHLELRAGEILGFAGLQGAGRAALAEALFGESPFTRGEMRLDGAPARFRRPRDAIKAGVGMLPGDRKAEGLLLMASVRDNGMVSARAFSGLTSSPWRTRFADLAAIDRLFARVDLRAASFDQEIASLSGGNQQKTVLARWLALAPRALIFIEPTRGVDVNAKAGVYHLMRELARGGTAIMMVSSDLPELVGAADRIVVMRGGTIVGEFPGGAGEAEIMRAATGETAPAGAA